MISNHNKKSCTWFQITISISWSPMFPNTAHWLQQFPYSSPLEADRPSLWTNWEMLLISKRCKMQTKHELCTNRKRQSIYGIWNSDLIRNATQQPKLNLPPTAKLVSIQSLKTERNMQADNRVLVGNIVQLRIAEFKSSSWLKAKCNSSTVKDTWEPSW